MTRRHAITLLSVLTIGLLGSLAATPAAAIDMNIAPSGTATQSSNYNATFVAGLAIDDDLLNFTHTAGADAGASWQVDLGGVFDLDEIVLFNRTSCCGSRLRDVTVDVLGSDGSTVLFTSPLLNPENVLGGGVVNVGPPSMSVNLHELAGGPVAGQFVRVTRTPDPDLSGSGGAGDANEANVLSLAEVRVFSDNGVPMAPDTPYSTTVEADSPVGYWRLGEASTSDPAVNRVGNQQGTYGGGVTLGQPGAIAGDADTAARFDGTSGDVLVGQHPDFNFAGEITYEAWIQPEAGDGTRNILNHGHQTGPNGESFFRINGNQYQAGRWPDEQKAVADATADVGSGEWVHLVGRYTGTRWELYRNGLLAGISPDTPNGAIQFNPETVGWAIAARGTGTERFFQGAIDEVALYDQALTPERITAHYTAGGGSVAAYESPGTTNAAPGHVATQSSNYNTTFVAGLAIDENLGNFTHTSAGQNLPSTWEVQLDANLPIERIVLHNRDSCCQSRLRDITVSILDPTGTTELFNSGLLNPENVLSGSSTWSWGPETIDLDLRRLTGAPVQGGLVRVVRTPDPDLSGTGGNGNADEADVLALGEVQVFGSNLALAGGAAQSSQLGGYGPGLAINGDVGDFTHTVNSDTNPTWELDLGATFQLDTVMLHNRDSCCGSRLRDITVEVLDAEGTVQFTSALLNPENVLGGGQLNVGPAAIGVDLNALTGGPVGGRFIRVTRTPDDDLSGTGGQGNADEGRVLSLGEVQAFTTFALTGGTAPGGFEQLNPDTGVIYHLDASRGLTLNGSNVAAWADQGAAGNDFSQADPTKQPLLVSAAIGGNSLDAVRFDGDNSNSGAAGDELILGTSTVPFTVIAVTTPLTGGGLRGIWGLENGDKGIRLNSNTNYRGTGQNTDGNDFANGNPDGVRVNGEVTTAYTVGEPHILSEIRGNSFNATTFGTTSLGQYFSTRSYNGDVGEVLVFSRPLNDAELAMVENSLSAKYDIPLAANDLYAGDEPANGDYDLDVFGIGRFDADNKLNAAGSAGLGIAVSNDVLDDGEFLLAGHNVPDNSILFEGPAGQQTQRWERVWYLDQTGDVDATLTFDFSDAGLGFAGLPPDQYFALLFSPTDALDFSVANSMPVLNGDQVSFFQAGAGLQDGYYTLGTFRIPEPSTFALAALGLVGLGWYVRRKRA